MLEGIFVFPTMLSINEREFFDTATANKQAQGYKWTELVKMSQSIHSSHLVMTTGTGKELVCSRYW